MAGAGSISNRRRLWKSPIDFTSTPRPVSTREVAETLESMPVRQARDARFGAHVRAFDAALQSAALEHLASVARASVELEARFEELDAPAWAVLREAIEVERALSGRAGALQAEFRGLVASLPPGGAFFGGPAFEKTRARMAALEDAIGAVDRARVEIHVANPALAFVDAHTIDLSRTNAELASELHGGADRVRAAIADAGEGIRSGDIGLRKLDRLVSRVKDAEGISESRAAGGDEKSRAVLEDFAIEAENEALLGAATMAASLAFTFATLGGGGVALGLAGAVFNLGAAAIELEAAGDLDDLGRASLSDADALVDVEAARERYSAALANVVLAGVDLVLAGAQLRVSRIVRRFKGAPSDYVPKTGIRETIGRSGTPSATPAVDAPHLGAIHRGMRRMPAEIRRRIEYLLRGGADGQKLRGEMARLEAQLQALNEQRAAPARYSEIWNQHVQLAAQLEIVEATGRTEAVPVMEYFLRSIRRPVDAAGLAEKVRIDRSALEKIAQRFKAARSEARALSGDALLEYTERELRSWLTDYFRIADPRMAPADLRLYYERGSPGTRASYRHGRGINVGESFSKADLFHEATHPMEYADAGVSRATKAWREARAKAVDPSLATKELAESNSGYRVGERAIARHDFHEDYVAKVYPDDDPATEVMTMFAQDLESAASALRLFGADPELFFLGLGLLWR